MPLVKVSGKYRHDMAGHTEQGLKEYSEVVGHVHGKPGNAIVAVAKILKKKDPSFDSLKTHKIEVLPEPPMELPPAPPVPPVVPPVEPPVVNDDAFEKELANVEPNGPATEPTGEDSGAGIFE